MSVDQALREQLLEGCHGLQLTLSDIQLDQQIQFLNLLSRWNKAYNLTAIRDPAMMVSHHLLDSLAILPYLQGKTVLDVGCGGGLPGIPLAIALPEIQFTLLDSNGKKTRFVQQTLIELGLKNVEVVKSRIELYRPEQVAGVEGYHGEQQFDTVTCRAFAALGDFYQQILPLCHQNTRILAMKGKRPDKEMVDIPADKVVAVQTLQVPDIEGDRHIISLKV